MDADEIAMYRAIAAAEGTEIKAPAGGAAGAMGPGGMAPSSAMLDNENAKQYHMFINGIVTADMDADEIAMYRAIAAAEGTEIKAGAAGAMGPGGMMPSSAMLDGEDAKQYQMYLNGMMSADMDPSEIAMYAAIAKAEGKTPASAGGEGSTTTVVVPQLTGEDLKQYNLYLNGLITPDMDAEELALYAATAKAHGVTPKAPMMLSKSFKLSKPRALVGTGYQGGYNPMFGANPYEGMDGSAYVAAIMAGADPKSLPMPKDGLDKSEVMMLRFMQGQNMTSGFAFPQFGSTPGAVPVTYNQQPSTGMGQPMFEDSEDMLINWIIQQQQATGQNPFLAPYQQQQQGGQNPYVPQQGQGMGQGGFGGFNNPFMNMDNMEYKNGVLVPDWTAALLQKSRYNGRRTKI